MQIWDDETPDMNSSKPTKAQQLDMLSDRLAALKRREGVIAKRLRRLELLQQGGVKRVQGNSSRDAS